MAVQVKKAKQFTFLWEGTNRKGVRHNGEIEGASIALVKADLRRQGIAPIKVRKKPVDLFGSDSTKKIKPKDVAIFSRQLATMMSAGVPLLQSFDIIAKGNEHSGLRKLTNALKIDIEGGNSLAQALRKHPRVFDELFCNLVRAGEQAGILENLLNKIATYKEKSEILKAKIKKAMMYPAGILTIAFIVTIILLVFVVPQFEDLFSSFGAELPALTQAVVDMSVFAQEWWWVILGSAGGGIYSIITLKRRSKGFRMAWDKFVLKLPVIGGILRKAVVARFARTLGTMFAAGVPLVEALESVAGAAGNQVYADGIMHMRDEISNGQQLQAVMAQSKLFPAMTVQMVAIGEESGSLDSMLAKVADFYEREVDDAVDNMSSLMEPLIMVILGILIGGLVLSMYLPIFEMGSVF
ncbi:MAG TPA: type II secretion system F family protein [Gammaproteobacteria bacterium]|nr:type II secretion system F family protein [Gammaproteobacteria bacterium]